MSMSPLWAVGVDDFIECQEHAKNLAPGAWQQAPENTVIGEPHEQSPRRNGKYDQVRRGRALALAALGFSKGHRKEHAKGG
jgi:hypothetical protein